MTPENLEAICTKEGPGMPDAERGRRAAARVQTTTKRGKTTHRPNHRRASQEEAHDAATLCRWLNAENAMIARTADIQSTADPGEMEYLISTMIGPAPLRHLVAIAHLEDTGNGRITVTAGLTPRNPDWTAVSPLWQRANAHRALITADTELRNQPALVMIFNARAWETLLQTADLNVLEKPAQGGASHLAEILRHHGAAEVHWIPNEAETSGPDGPPDPYTWSSWVSDMPEDLKTSPNGWTLNRNLLHTWLLQDVVQATTLAEYADTNARAAISMAQQARREGREQAAHGAAIAAALMARRAQTCLDQAAGLARQGAPGHESANQIAELSARVRSTQSQIGQLPATKGDSDQLWYADACHRLLRHRSCTEMVPTMLEAARYVPNTGYNQYIMALTGQQICAWPSDNIYEIPQDYPVGREPDPELASVIRISEEEMNTAAAHVLAQLNGAATTALSPQLALFPELAQRLQSTLVPAVGCDCGFEYAKLGPREDDATHVSVGWTGFYWQGTRHFKGAAEAYPKDYPGPLVKGHATQLQMRFAAIVPDGPDAAYNPGLQPFYNMYAAIEAAAANGWHTITGDNINQLDDAAQAEGLSLEDRKVMFRTLTGNDPSLAGYLAYNSDREAAETEFGRHPNRPSPRLPRESARRLENAARAAGFPARHAALIGASGPTERQ